MFKKILDYVIVIEQEDFTDSYNALTSLKEYRS